MVKVDATGLPTIALGDSDRVQVGDDVVAIGNALALQGGLTVTRGIISGLHREVGTNTGSALEDVIQTDAAINPGNSGGPLVDAQGRVIGINTAIADPGSAQNVGFAIPISNAKVIIEQLRLGRQPAQLGVKTVDVDQAKLDGNTVDVDKGAYVTDVSSGSPAARAGIRAGDVVVKVDGGDIASAAALGGVIRQHKPGDEVEIELEPRGRFRHRPRHPERVAHFLTRLVDRVASASTPRSRGSDARYADPHVDGVRRARAGTAAGSREGRVPRPRRAALGGPRRLR